MLLAPAGTKVLGSWAEVLLGGSAPRVDIWPGLGSRGGC